jgi:hypothetical protein
LNPSDLIGRAWVGTDWIDKATFNEHFLPVFQSFGRVDVEKGNAATVAVIVVTRGEAQAPDSAHFQV